MGYRQIRREENVEVDRFSKFALVTVLKPGPEPDDRENKVIVEYLPKPSTQNKIKEVLQGHTG